MTALDSPDLFNAALVAADPALMAYQAAATRPVITGIGVVTPVGSSVQALCDLARSGRNGFAPVTRFDTSWCESDLACAFPAGDDASRKANGFRRKWMDRAVWYLLDALDHALASSGVDLKSYDPERIAVVLGTSHSGLVTTEDLYWSHLAGEFGDEDARRILAIPASHIAAAVAVATGAKGVRRTISSACASSTGAMGVAADLIRSGDADLVITGGTDTVSVAVTAGFNSLRALASNGCAPFSTQAGITLGEGAGVFLLERLDKARGRGAAVRAEILGYALSGDAHHATAPDDNGDGIARVLRAALQDASIAPSEVDYLSAHGTGTDANDIAESRASAAVFGRGVPLSTPKSIFGHTLGASGVIETALTLGMAAQGLIPPTLGFDAPRDGCEALDYVPNAARAADIDTFVCNNYGFGGNNASVVLRRHPALRAQARPAGTGRARVLVSGASAVNAAGLAGAEGLRALIAGGDAPCAPVVTVADDRLPAAFKRKIGRTSPMVKFAVSATGEALAAAGLDEALCAETGLIYGVVTGAQRSTEKYMESVAWDGPGQASATQFPNTTNNAPGGQVSIAYGLKGYNTTLCGASGSLGYAIDLVAAGRQDRVVSAAADEHSPLLEQFYRHAGALADGPVQPFAGAPGIPFGEGGAAVLFEGAASLAARGGQALAEVLGWAEAQDATYLGVNRRGDGLSRAIGLALTRAGRGLADVALVVAQGVGPGYLAQAELRALAPLVAAGVRIVSPVAAAGYGPAHTPVAMLGAAAAMAADVGACVLCAGIDLTGVAFAAVLAPAGAEGRP